MVVEISLTKEVLRNYGRTDGRTDGRTGRTTDRCKPVYPPLFQSGGIVKNKQEKAGLQSHGTIHHYQPAYQI